jgi:hypothetical protein
MEGGPLATCQEDGGWSSKEPGRNPTISTQYQQSYGGCICRSESASLLVPDPIEESIHKKNPGFVPTRIKQCYMILLGKAVHRRLQQWY